MDEGILEKIKVAYCFELFNFRGINESTAKNHPNENAKMENCKFDTALFLGNSSRWF